VETFNSIHEIQKIINDLKIKGKTIGFVPTMGALHKGHISLIKDSKKENDITIISIFVNPTQFGPKEDFSKYPREILIDQEKCIEAGADILFMPDKSSIYVRPTNISTQIYVPYLSRLLCGKTRKNFFKGVCMVVNRLFNIIKPDKAYFGEKDFQQLVIIRQMVKDLFLSVEIVSCPIIRGADGLALSSRNSYLSKPEIKEASHIYSSLLLAKHLFDTGINSVDSVIHDLKGYLEKNTSILIDYLKVVNPDTLKERKIIRKNDRLLIAGYLGKTRLIDNIKF
jgi:pantoate--beta-alanine ligase